MSELEIPISVGELFDKISILQIKLQRILDKEKLENIKHELNLLITKSCNFGDNNRFINILFDINNLLWEEEDKLRFFESQKEFGQNFVSSARSIYKINDLRYKIKNLINDLFKSKVKEEKSYV